MADSELQCLLNEIRVWSDKVEDYSTRLEDMQQRGVTGFAIEAMCKNLHSAIQTKQGLEEYLDKMLFGNTEK